MEIKVASMFAGIGGICLAFKNAGCKIVWANEIDKSACKTYRENFGSSYLVEDNIKNIQRNISIFTQYVPNTNGEYGDIS